MKSRFILLVLCGVAVLVSVGILSTRWLAFLVTSDDPPPNVSIFPADHGLPNTIAGYRVVSVRTAETTACMPSGMAVVTLQSDALNAEGARSIDVRAIYEELERLVPDHGLRWYVEVVGPGASAVESAAGNAEWNELFADGDCVTFHPIVTLTPTPITGGSSAPKP